MVSMGHSSSWDNLGMTQRYHYKCARCGSKRHTRRIYWRDSKEDHLVGYFCLNCHHLEEDKAETLMPKGKRSSEPKPKEEPIIFSGPRSRGPSGLRPSGQSPYHPPDIFSEIGDQ